jgi:HlyD family secretion protein
LLDARSQLEVEAKLKATEAAEELATSSLASAVELSELAQHQYDRAKQLILTNAVSREEFDSAEHQARAAKANVRVAEFGCKVKRFESELARVALLRIKHDSGETDASAIRIIAPTSGNVLRVFHEDESVVSVGTQLLEIGEVQDMELVFDILSTEATRIQPGDKIILEHWGGDNNLLAVVRHVEPSAFLKISALGVEEKRVNVIADFVSPWEDRKRLGDGFRVEARIVVDATAASSLKLASGAFFRHQGAWHVFRIRNSKAELVRVETGLTNGLETEVLKGLDQGDTVISYPTDEIRPGVRVIYP